MFSIVLAVANRVLGLQRHQVISLSWCSIHLKSKYVSKFHLSRPVGVLSLSTPRTLSPSSIFWLLLQGISGVSHDDAGDDVGGVVIDCGDDCHGSPPFRAPIRLPENVVVDVVIVTKREGVS